MWTTIVGAVISALLTLVIAVVRSGNRRLEEKLMCIDSDFKALNGKFFSHITDPSLHAAEVARVSEQIKNLLQTVKVAHERIDRLEGSHRG